MTKIIPMAEVEDVVKWREGFVTHASLFQKQTVKPPICFATKAEENRIVIEFEVEDLDAFFAGLDSEETADAMAYDGVKRDTVEFFVLDGEFAF